MLFGFVEKKKPEFKKRAVTAKKKTETQKRTLIQISTNDYMCVMIPLI